MLPGHVDSTDILVRAGLVGDADVRLLDAYYMSRKHISASIRGGFRESGMTDRYVDLLKQGFIKRAFTPPTPKRPKVERPIVACNRCGDWHREGKHTVKVKA